MESKTRAIAPIEDAPVGEQGADWTDYKRSLMQHVAADPHERRAGASFGSRGRQEWRLLELIRHAPRRSNLDS